MNTCLRCKWSKLMQQQNIPIRLYTNVYRIVVIVLNNASRFWRKWSSDSWAYCREHFSSFYHDQRELHFVLLMNLKAYTYCIPVSWCEGEWSEDACWMYVCMHVKKASVESIMCLSSSFNHWFQTRPMTPGINYCIISGSGLTHL